MTARVSLAWLMAAVCLASALAAVGTLLAPLLMAVGLGWFWLGCTEWKGGRP
jgi:hypothetical protein